MPWCPSAVADFMACPRLWALNRQGVPGRERDTTALDMGTAYHAAMAAYWGDKDVPEAWMDAVAATVPACTGQLVAYELVLGGPPDEAARHGRYPGTVDLVTEDAEGLIVTDYKTKGKKLSKREVERELRQTQRSWQLMNYAWFVKEQFRRPVTRIRKIVVADQVYHATVPVTQAQLMAWFSHALQVWMAMDHLDDQGWTRAVQSEAHCERYGWDWRCQYYEHCWGGDTDVQE